MAPASDFPYRCRRNSYEYAIEWNEAKIDFFVNDEKYFTFAYTSGGKVVSGRPLQMHLDQPRHDVDSRQNCTKGNDERHHGPLRLLARLRYLLLQIAYRRAQIAT